MKAMTKEITIINEEGETKKKIKIRKKGNMNEKIF